MRKWMPLIQHSLLGTLIFSVLAACSTAPQFGKLSERQITARAMWLERCKKSGEFIHKTINGVEGVALLKLRNLNTNFEDQFLEEDLYGGDVGGLGYIKYFLRGGLLDRTSDFGVGREAQRQRGYLYVDYTDPTDGQRYRYTGRLEEPWQTDKSYLRGHLLFRADKRPTQEPMPRYGVTFEDISTRQEREYWIAGSSLKVIDLQTGEVIAERIGYMYDWAQGSRVGNRSPWLFAAENACPSFRQPGKPTSQAPAASFQTGQTLNFVEKVLRPAK